jgi:hypothetical protein
MMGMAGALENILMTRKPLMRIISEKSSAASASSSMIMTVFCLGFIRLLYRAKNSIKGWNLQGRIYFAMPL